MIIEGTLDNTEVSAKSRISLDAPMSPLIEESAKREYFTGISSPTFVEERSSSGQFLSESFSSTPVSYNYFYVSNTTDSVASDDFIEFLHSERRPGHRGYAQENVESDSLSKAMEDRVKLLARKYVAKEKFSDEESARLAIVTERVRKLLPAVTVSEYEALEGVLVTLSEVAQNNEVLREKLRALKNAGK